MRIESEAGLVALQEAGRKKLKPKRPRIAVGLATCGAAVGGRKVYDSLKNAVARAGAEIDCTTVGCIGYCREEPLVNITLPGKPLVILRRVAETDADGIVRLAMEGEVPVKKALCKVPSWDHVTGYVMEYGKGFPDIPLYEDVPFFAPQKKVILRNAGFIDPKDIGEYFAAGGYSAALKAVTRMEPEEIIAEVEKSGLRGRGGAGFPTGLKWRITRDAPGGRDKYLVCNADEGDPGAYMNRNEMESDPHMLIEGMVIGAYAMGLMHGLIYIRSEYPLAIERLNHAIDEAREHGLLGENIFGTEFSFDIRIARGAGAFVCGESTALVASIEGRTGRPHPRPPRLTDPEGGLFTKPTDLNNVETWCNVPAIVANGSGWYAGIGAPENAGTKVFSLVGKVDRVGLVEVPLGTPIRTIVFDAGNGGADGKKVKAVQTGGPSGGCIPLRLFDTPVDYESLNRAGTIMGSGGIVVMDEETDMVDIARYFVNFATGESCGKCVPCREGLKHTLLLINRIQAGKATAKDLATLQEVCETIAATSLCGLGQTAPNPVLTTLAYFREEYEAKVRP